MLGEINDFLFVNYSDALQKSFFYHYDFSDIGNTFCNFIWTMFGIQTLLSVSSEGRKLFYSHFSWAMKIPPDTWQALLFTWSLCSSALSKDVCKRCLFFSRRDAFAYKCKQGAKLSAHCVYMSTSSHQWTSLSRSHMWSPYTNGHRWPLTLRHSSFARFLQCLFYIIKQPCYAWKKNMWRLNKKGYLN